MSILNQQGGSMKHIETLPFNDARIMVRSGLEHLQVARTLI
jgi:hypothetical protein